MQEQDFFAQIAMTKHPMRTDDLEFPPLPVPKKQFQYSLMDCPTVPDRTYEERMEDFHRKLNGLRKYYEPFMRDLLPAFPEKEEVQELKTFSFRYAGDHELFSGMFSGSEQWETVTIPDYRGPEGKWKGFYQTEFSARHLKEGEQAVIRFASVDYRATIYVNGVCVGSHVGFFAPFEVNVTDCLQNTNTLVIQVENDVSILGKGVLDGDKIYAATGPGWDDPELGWHHCPAGAGILDSVLFAICPSVRITDLFVRPNIDEHFAEVRMGVQNDTGVVQEGYALTLRALPKNHEGEEIGNMAVSIPYIGVGANEYRFAIPFQNERLWEPDTPWLYGMMAELSKGDVVSRHKGTFGIRKFVSDESSDPKGKFYFNNRPIVLRGANEMGHLQQCVMNGEDDQLVDDILIAKLCHMNYYRVTQRPVQKKIYDYFDMLGMMHQCDLPLFSFLRRNQVCEAIKQASELEHLIRSHPSSILVSLINEPMSIRYTGDPNDKYSKRYLQKGHRHLLRDELEAFFAAARKAIYIENPDRVVKNAEGDYDPPTMEGMPDFHCYTMWYSNHAMPIGKLYKGYIPPVKRGWMMGCGEYGAEGLDNLSVMEKYYPKEWLKTNPDGTWYPDRISHSQTFSVQGDWYPEQTEIKKWILESQKHQANATTTMTDAFRRRADLINHTAIHLLIDAWPSGWMKTLLDVDRQPKLAYFAYMDSLVPFRVNLRCDRNTWYEGETVQVEAWLLNDTADTKQGKLVATVTLDGKKLASYELEAQIGAAAAVCAGTIPVTAPAVEHISSLRVELGFLDKDGNFVHAEKKDFTVYPVRSHALPVACVGTDAEEAARALRLETVAPQEANSILISSGIQKDLDQAAKWAEEGKTVMLLLPEENCKRALGKIELETKGCGPVFFAATVPEAEKYHLTMLYNGKEDYIDFSGTHTIETKAPGCDLVYTYGKQGFNGSFGAKPHLPFVKEIPLGKGRLIAVSMPLKGRLAVNPNLDAFLLDCLLGVIGA